MKGTERQALAVALVFMCALVLLLVSAPVEGRCRWRWDCTEPSRCRQVPICESPLDRPGSPPIEIPPIPPPTIAPLPPLVLPPLGTSACAPRFLCDARGRCRWQTVCE
jgi:hypothetical protein